MGQATVRSAWTGRLEGQLVPARPGHPAEWIEMLVHRQTVEILLNGRSLGVLDRDAVRLWLAAPAEPMRLDDGQLTLRYQVLLLTVGGRRFELPVHFERELRAHA
jgi:hypothetical protein